MTEFANQGRVVKRLFWGVKCELIKRISWTETDLRKKKTKTKIKTKCKRLPTTSPCILLAILGSPTDVAIRVGSRGKVLGVRMCKTLLLKMSCICTRIKNNSQINALALSLAMKQRFETEAWSNNSENGLLNSPLPLSTPNLTYPFRLFRTFYSLSAFNIQHGVYTQEMLRAHSREECVRFPG